MLLRGAQVRPSLGGRGRLRWQRTRSARLKQRSPLGQPARVLPLAPGRFRRRAALALARERRSRSSLLWLLLLGLLGLAVAPLFAFGHGLPPLRLRSRITWILIELKREAVLRRATQRRQCPPAQPAPWALRSAKAHAALVT